MSAESGGAPAPKHKARTPLTYDRNATPLVARYEWGECHENRLYLKSISQLEWQPTGLVYFYNIDAFLNQCEILHELGIAIPPMPPGIRVRLTTRQFAEVLAHPIAEIREWIVINISTRIRLRRSPPRRDETPEP